MHYRVGCVVLLALLMAALCWPLAAQAQPLATPILPPASMFQLPFSISESWTFNGVHGPRREAIDFSVGRPWPRWKSDTSAIWVVAAADGVVRKTASCGVEIDHADGWTTVYYHLENIVHEAGPIKANERLANIANTPREATCEGGSASAPHLHFALKYRGEFVPIDGLALSGWRIHSGRGGYDSNCKRMYLYHGDERLCPYTSPLANHGIPADSDQGVVPSGPLASSQAGEPDMPSGQSAEIELDTPAPDTAARGQVEVRGWAIDRAAPSSTGIDYIHLYLDGPAGQGKFVGAADYALERPDVAAALGEPRYVRAGFQYEWDVTGVAAGSHTLFIYAHSTAANWSYITRSIVVEP